MKLPDLALVLALALTMVASTAQARVQAQVHKCTVDGKVTYSQVPCERGDAAVLEVPRAPAATEDAAADLKRMRRASAQMEKERHADEAAQARADARSDRDAARRRQRCDKLTLQSKYAEEDARRAQPAAQEAARLKAQRAREQMALECRT